jgi:acetylglutamate kinase
LRFTVKLGGSILEDAATRAGVLGEVGELAAAGHEIILVHGGGKTLTRRLGQLGLQSRFVDGLRVTDARTLEAAVMVLAGEVNKRLVLELERLGTRALGLCGADAASLRCVRLEGSPGEALGYVGRPVSVNRAFFELLLAERIVPVVASLGLGYDFELYNVNADSAASACAWGTDSQALVYLTDVGGVRGEDGSVLRRIGRREIERLREAGVICGGMLPKTLACLEALDHRVPAACILPGTERGALGRFAAGNCDEGSVIHD